MSYILKIDDREVKTDEKEKKDERNKIPRELFDIISAKRIIDIIVKRLHTGDYAIYYQIVLLFNFERKTYDDFASSMKDGRLSQQIENMIKLRKETGCIIGFIIEGKLHKEHGHITSSQIQAKLLSMTINHNIPIIYTTDMEDTVIKLFHMIDLYNLDENITALIDIQQKNANNNNDEFDKIKIDPCLRPIEKTIEWMAIECISAIPQISEATSKVLLKKYNILELITQTPKVDDIAELIYPSSGAKFGEARAKTFIKNLKKEEVLIKILVAINGITKPNAKSIVNLNSLDVDLIAELEKISKDGKNTKKKIGKKIANRIIEIFSYKILTKNKNL